MEEDRMCVAMNKMLDKDNIMDINKDTNKYPKDKDPNNSKTNNPNQMDKLKAVKYKCINSIWVKTKNSHAKEKRKK